MSDKVLRIGVIQGKKVVEERRLKRRIPVSVGGNAKNTFVAEGKKMPETWPLFELKSGGYELVFSETMTGYVHIGDEKVKLKDLVDKGEATKQGDRYRLSLDEKGGGRVQVAEDVSILFHFMKPQVAAPPAPLPAAMKSSFLATLEPYFTGVLAASFILHAIFTLVISVSERSLTTPSREDVLKYMASVQPQKVIIKKKPKEVAEVVDEDKVGEEEVVEKKVEKEAAKEEKTAGKPEKGSGADDKKREAVRNKVRNKALAAVIGAMGSGSGGVGDIFKAGSGIGADVADSLAGTDGVGVASGGGDVTRRGADGGGGSGDAAGIEGGLGTSGGGKVGGTGSKSKKRKKVSGSARVGAVTPIDGTVDKRGVQKALKRRGAAFQACYETALKSNSKLKGKLVVEFTINQRGKVGSASVIKDGLGSTSVSRCVIGVLKRIRFPKPDDGSVTITNSFVFTPNS